MDSKKSKKAKSRQRALTVIFDWAGAMVFALAILLTVLTHLFRVVGVNGHSMNPTLFDEQRLLLSVVSTEYERGDIIVIDRYTEEPLIKRVIAVGGDAVAIKEGTVYVNGEPLKETYTFGETENKQFVGTQAVPEGYYFVLGDNREISKDSRYEIIGMVSEKDVVGKALLRVWPISDFGLIYG